MFAFVFGINLVFSTSLIIKKFKIKIKIKSFGFSVYFSEVLVPGLRP
jgi:hypothetical protein